MGSEMCIRDRSFALTRKADETSQIGSLKYHAEKKALAILLERGDAVDILLHLPVREARAAVARVLFVPKKISGFLLGA